ncbi:Carcinine transporter [Blattella germanica]|nr:Carcinine transporter [Blattella germanica]
MDLDDLLPQVGEFGRYQKLLVWLVCLPACVPCGFCAFNQLFMADVPDHWCRIPELMDLPGIGPQERRALAIPSDVSYRFYIHTSVRLILKPVQFLL